MRRLLNTRVCATRDLRSRMFEGHRRKTSASTPTCFAACTSTDLRARVAAQEAFDVCSSAISAPVNFAILNVSMDHADMLEAPGVVWASLMHSAQSHGLSAPTMIAQVVRQQRFGGPSFLELVLGSIPDLRSQAYTFDSIPTSFHDDTFVNLCMVDWRLCQQHLTDINRRLGVVSGLTLAPTVGASRG